MTRDMKSFERNVLDAVWNSKRLWAIHILANGALMWAFFEWLRIPDETGGYVLATVVSGLLVVYVALWLHAATFDFYHRVHTGGDTALGRSFLATAVRVPAFLIWAVIFVLVLWMISQLFDYNEQFGVWARHMLPGFARPHVSPRSMISLSGYGFWFLFGFLWPIVFLPIGAEVAAHNFRGYLGRHLLAATRPLRSLRFWALYLVCFIIGTYIPFTLANMTPDTPSPLNEQMRSMVVRLGAGYVLAVTMWLIVASAITRAIAAREPEAAPAGTPAAAPVTT